MVRMQYTREGEFKKQIKIKNKAKEKSNSSFLDFFSVVALLLCYYSWRTKLLTLIHFVIQNTYQGLLLSSRDIAYKKRERAIHDGTAYLNSSKINGKSFN